VYKIIISNTAEKELEKLPLAVNKKAEQVFEKLSNNPRPAGCVKLKGTQESLWRVRIGNYRILYTIEDQIQIVDIRSVGDRKDVYK
jgi:mRNA interferase RelE/StbE